MRGLNLCMLFGHYWVEIETDRHKFNFKTIVYDELMAVEKCMRCERIRVDRKIAIIGEEYNGFRR